MKAKPILMHGRSIRKLLAGRKSQTRRIVKDFEIVRVSDRREFVARSPYPLSKTDRGDCAYVELSDGRFVGIPSPYGGPGDLLYVRETFCFEAEPDGGLTGSVIYRATHEGVEPLKLDENGCVIDGASPWRSSIHMPRWASRITLHLTDVRVERVQEISTEDCKAEGVEPNGNMHGYLGAGYRPAFQKLWDDTNGPGAWDRNDYVWRLGFDVIHANVDEVLACPVAHGITEAA